MTPEYTKILTLTHNREKETKHRKDKITKFKKFKLH